ncbi:Uncharacterized protein T06_13777 [Trichinella sp. T6]|nr:Uncharacterized protein T06_13777 [Trichinella sp. T6]
MFRLGKRSRSGLLSSSGDVFADGCGLCPMDSSLSVSTLGGTDGPQYDILCWFRSTQRRSVLQISDSTSFVVLRERAPLPNSQRLSSAPSLAYVQTKLLLESSFAEPLWCICFVGSWLCPQPLPINLGSSWHLSASFWLFPQAFGSSFLRRHFVGAFQESYVRDECLLTRNSANMLFRKYANDFREKSSMNERKYRAPPTDATCMRPHMSECTSSRTSSDLLLADLGKGKRHCFPFKQVTQSVFVIASDGMPVACPSCKSFIDPRLKCPSRRCHRSGTSCTAIAQWSHRFSRYIPRICCLRTSTAKSTIRQPFSSKIYSTYRQEIQGQFRSMSNVVGHHRLLSSERNFHDPASFSRYICSIGNGHCVCSATIVLFHPIVTMILVRFLLISQRPAIAYHKGTKLDSEIENLSFATARACTQVGISKNSVVSHTRDLAGSICGKNFLIVVDAFSKWLEVSALKNTTSESVISCLRQIFSIHGLLDIIVSDNGTQFTRFSGILK